MKCGTKVAVLVLAAALLCGVLPAGAQQDERLAKLIQTVKGTLEKSKSAHMQMEIKVEIPGVQIPQNMMPTAEIWTRDQSVRFELPMMNMVMVFTPDELVFYMGNFGVAMHAPKETVQKFMEQRDAVMKQLNLPTDPNLMFIALLEKGGMKITGEETVADVDCWVLEVDPTMLAAMKEQGNMMGMGMGMGMGGDAQQDVDFKSCVVGLEKETGMLRRMAMDMSVAQPGGAVQMDMKIGITVPVVEIGIEVPDALMKFDLPEGTKVVEWTPDMTAADIGKAFQAEIMKAVPGNQPGGAAGEQ